jgi:hypothetical protein
MHPELESWVWDRSYQVNGMLNWPGGVGGLERWMQERGFAEGPDRKPGRPKEAFLAALAHRSIRRSSGIYQSLAERCTFRDCRDPSFGKFLSTLQS